MTRPSSLALALAAFVAAGCGSHSLLKSSQSGATGGGSQPGTPGGAIPPVEETCAVDAPNGSLVVATDRGLVEGTQVEGALAFLGIPFAAPPVGPLRFKAPQSHACWRDTFPAKTYAPECPQKDLVSGKVTGQEDCLALNVWTPSISDTQKRPVMVFIYGGGDTIGSTHDGLLSSLYDGRMLAARENAVVVTPAYRLNAFGFLVHPALEAQGDKGNFAILDLVSALKWVQRNAGAFGGDPTRVMIFGESAGAINTCSLYASPQAKGLFSRALMESGVCGTQSREVAEKKALALAAAVGCGGPDAADCLRQLPVEKLEGAIDGFGSQVGQATAALQDGLMANLAWAQVVDGDVLPDSPLNLILKGEHNHVPFAIGTNADEAILFQSPSLSTCSDYEANVKTGFGAGAAAVLSAYPCDILNPKGAPVALETDLFFTCPSRRAAKAAAVNQSQPVYRYVFTHGLRLSPLGVLRASHAVELPFVFHTFGSLGIVPTPGELSLSNAMMDSWGGFAASGVPGASWPLFAADNNALQVWDVSPHNVAGYRDDKCDTLEGVTTVGLGG